MPAQRFARVFCNANWLPQAHSAPPKITADGLLESYYRRLSNRLVGSSLWSCLIDKYRQIGETRSVGATWSGSDLQNKILQIQYALPVRAGRQPHPNLVY